MTHREIEQTILRLRRDGFIAEITPDGHWKISRWDVTAPVYAAATPAAGTPSTICWRRSGDVCRPQPTPDQGSMLMTIMTLDEIQQALVETGNIAAAARKLGVRWHTVRDRLAKAGIEVPRARGGAQPTYSDAALINLYRMTGSTGDVSAATGLHASGIQRRLKKLGVELTGSGYYRDPLAGLR